MKLINVFILGFILLGSTFLLMSRNDSNSSEGESSPQLSKAVPSTISPTIKDIIHKEIVVTGEYVCLPKKDTGGPMTLECALGIKSDKGEYMSLDMGKLLQLGITPQFATGDQIEVKGLFIPIEELSSDRWQTYNITGILQVSEAKKL